MKNTCSIFVLILISFFPSCTDKPDIDLGEERDKVIQVIDNYSKAHEERDLNLLMSCFSDDPDIIILGTDEDELWVEKMSMGESQQVAYETFDKITLSVRDRMVKMNQSGTEAWFYIKVNWYVESGGNEFSINGVRTTGVLEKQNKQWKIVQLHTSMPVVGQAVPY
jgi:ketosteroid isomerase-like protein